MNKKPEFKQVDNKLLTHLNACVKCGLCAESCMFYKTFKEPEYIPASKVALVSSVYRRYNTLSGRLIPGLVGAEEMTDKMAE